MWSDILTDHNMECSISSKTLSLLKNAVLSGRLACLHQVNLKDVSHVVGFSIPRESQDDTFLDGYLPTDLNINGYCFSLNEGASDVSKVKAACKQKLETHQDVCSSPTVPVLIVGSDSDELFSCNIHTWEVKPMSLVIPSDNVLDKFMYVRLKCAFRVEQEHQIKEFKSDLRSKINVLQREVQGKATVFRVENSDVLLYPGGRDNHGNGTMKCQELLHLIHDEAEDHGHQKKNKDIGKAVVGVELLTQTTGAIAGDNNMSCAPIIHHNHDSFDQLDLVLPVDVVVYVHPEELASCLYERLTQGVSRQLEAMYNCLVTHQNGSLHTPVPFHIRPDDVGHILTVVYPDGVADKQLEAKRKEIHELFALPDNIPLVRRQNVFRFPDEKAPGGYLVNPHLALSALQAPGHVSLVRGQYSYHHYMQDRMDDNGWGCAYRSLQTLFSWFRFQGYTEKTIPSHREIQQALVDIGDKEAKFVGTKQWIGSTEVNYVLDHLLGVESKILFVSSGAELGSKGRELMMHFEGQGTPVMIGGGVLAHTILGVDFNEVTGNTRFLILDPHYTGGEDLKVIKDKGWCGWKGADFWDKNAYYNLCLPQRPKMI